MTDNKLTFLGVEYRCEGEWYAADAGLCSSDVYDELDHTYTYAFFIGIRLINRTRGFNTPHQASTAADKYARAELERMRAEINRLLQTEPMKENHMKNDTAITATFDNSWGRPVVTGHDDDIAGIQHEDELTDLERRVASSLSTSPISAGEISSDTHTPMWVVISVLRSLWQLGLASPTWQGLWVTPFKGCYEITRRSTTWQQ